MILMALSLALIGVLVLGPAAMAEPNPVAPAASRDAAPACRTDYLVLDARVIAETQNAELRVGTPHKSPHNPLFIEDKPWEPRFDNLYANVVFDESEGLYKCWYSPFIIDEATTSTPVEDRAAVPYRPAQREMGVCHAYSEDGVHWVKPDLGLVAFDGDMANNIVVRGPHGAGVMRDLHDPDPARRYKLMYKGEDAMAVAFSPDGLHWSEPRACPEINAAGDTHNNAVWVPERDEYVLFTRLWDRENRVRIEGWSSSPDFVHWTPARPLLRGLEQHLQVYAMPVFRYKGVFLGLPAIFNTQTDRTHTELAWSPDAITWHRISPGTPFIDTAAKEGAVDWGCVYAAAYPVSLSGEIRLYYGGSDGPHTGWRHGALCLAALRPDGFAGYAPVNAGDPAVVTTELLPLGGGVLHVTTDVAPGGYAAVEVLDADGVVVGAGARIGRSGTKQRVVWKDGADPLAGAHGDVRLRFSLDQAALYAFGFGE